MFPEETAFTDVPVDESLYPLTAVYRACYRLTDRFYFWLHRHQGLLYVRIWNQDAEHAPSELAGVLSNVLLDEALREAIATETATVRNTLISTALGEALRDPL